jgi:hypothetical protein
VDPPFAELREGIKRIRVTELRDADGSAKLLDSLNPPIEKNLVFPHKLLAIPTSSGNNAAVKPYKEFRGSRSAVY